MAKRKSKMFFKFDSKEVQGEGSFVVLRNLNWADLRELMQPAGAGADANAIATELMPRLVWDWDWVDDEDNALPNPQADPHIFDLLTVEEINFLSDKLQTIAGKLNDTKN